MKTILSLVVFLYLPVVAWGRESSNLVANAGFETGTLVGWSGNMWQMSIRPEARSGAYCGSIWDPGFYDPDLEITVGGQGFMWQEVDLSAFADAIDQGVAQLRGGVYAMGSEFLSLSVTICDATNGVLDHEEMTQGMSDEYLHMAVTNLLSPSARKAFIEFGVFSSSLLQYAWAMFDDAYLHIDYPNPPTITGVSYTGGWITLNVADLNPSESYAVEWKENLNNPEWSVITNITPPGEQQEIRFPTTTPQAFFRLHSQ